MYFDYEAIKELARQAKVSPQTLLAMSPKNDPFYVGTKADIRNAEWFYDQVWEPAGYTVAHLRRLHYWAVSQPDMRLPIAIKQGEFKTDKYLNSQAAWQFMCQACKSARYLDYIPYEAITDNKNPDPIINFEKNITGRNIDFQIDQFSTESPYIWMYAPRYADYAPWEIILCCEKSTINDILEPVARRYHGDVLTFQGEASLTSVVNVINRSKDHGRNVAVFYISDHDPAGNSMSNAFARKLELLRRDADSPRCVLHVVALTNDQVNDYQLPRTPLKASELRADKFESAFGVGGVELDALVALRPGVLEGLLEDAIEPYFDHDLNKELIDIRNRATAQVELEAGNIMDKYSDMFERLEKMNNELSEMDIDMSEMLEGVEGIADGATWSALLDTDREYLKQIEHYHRHRGRTQDE